MIFKRRGFGVIFVVWAIVLYLDAASPSAERMAPAIEYDHPDKYLAQGAQTTMAPGHQATIRLLGIGKDSVAEIERLIAWKRQFRNKPAGGRHVGRRTVNEILDSRELTGCHDHGLLLAAALRQCGYPAIMVDATGIGWSKAYPEQRKGYVGHVFIETFVSGKWILIDSTTGRMAMDYDPRNPVVPLKNDGDATGYYVMFKGTDPAGYGIRDIRELNAAQDRFAATLRAGR